MATPQANFRLTGYITGLRDGSPAPIALAQITVTNAIGQRQFVSLVQGDNTIAIPAGATWVLIVPDTTNTTALRLKGNAADIGWPLGTAQPTLLPIGSGAVLILTATADLTTKVELLFL